MLSKAVILALVASAAAHSGVPLVKGDVAGQMTALGINPDIPVSNRNKNVIEPDANTMPSTKDVTANGLGTLNGKTKVTMDMIPAAVKNAGGTSIPVVKDTIDITYRQMVIDGRFDETKGAAVLIDPTATGNFKAAVKAKVLVAPDVVKTANIQGTTVVGQDMPMKVQIPAGLQCTGPQATCLVRVVNGQNEGNNHWGGHFVFTQDGATAGATPAAPPASGPAARAAMAVRSEAKLNQLVADLKKIQLRSEDGPTVEDMEEFERTH